MRLGLRAALAGIATLALFLELSRNAEAGFVQIQRTQIAIYISMNVLPGPYGRLSDPRRIAAADGARFDVAQVQKQSGVPVQANVIANPTGSLLTSNVNTITVTQTAGTTATYPCAYKVKVTTTVTAWTLYTGLSNDFNSNWNGNTVSWLDYVSTGAPAPTATPQSFAVYPDNNNAWQSDRKGSTTFEECVDLTVVIPIMVLGGTYSSNAVYSLYY